MYRLIFTAIILFMLAASVAAAPHGGEEFTLGQPDGSLVRALVWGDEFHQEVESLDGYTLIRGADGWICYAELSADGAEYVSTGIRYTDRSRAPGTRKGLRISRESASEKRRVKRGVLGYDELVAPTAFSEGMKKRSSAVVPDGISPAPMAEARRIVGLTVLIDFPDQKTTVTQTDMDQFCNRPGGVNGTNAAGSCYDYFYDVSNGLLEYVNIVTPFVTVDSNKTYYDRGTNYQYVPHLLTHALRKLRDSGFDISEVTTETANRREVAVALNVFYAGSATQGWANGIWPHSGTYRAPAGESAVTIGGIGFSRYQLSSLGTRDAAPGIGTFVHENGHMVMRWGDLYPYDDLPNVVGAYCVMGSSHSANPQMPNPYFRDLAGWISVTDITAMNATLAHTANSHEAYKFTRNNNESYYIEARRRTGRSGNMPGEGLIIWHAHRSGDNANLNNNNPFPQLRVIQANNANSTSQPFVALPSGSAAANVPYRSDGGSRNTEFSRISSPAALYYDGTPSNIDVSDVSALGSVMSFKIGSGAAGPAVYLLTVDGGSGSGLYEAGTKVSISAPETNSAGRAFMRWTSSALESATENVYAAATAVTTLAAEAVITARYARLFALPGQVEADTAGYAHGYTSVSNTANGATGNRVARVTDTSKFAEYLVDVGNAGTYKLSYRLLTNTSSAGKFYLRNAASGAILDSVIVPASTRTSMQTVEGGTATLAKGKAVLRLEAAGGTYSIDWFAAEPVAGTTLVARSAGAPPAYGIKAGPRGSVSFQVPSAARVSVKVYDIRGRQAAVLCDGEKQPGVYNVSVAGLAQGLYVVRMRSGGYSKDIKMNYYRGF